MEKGKRGVVPFLLVAALLAGLLAVPMTGTVEAKAATVKKVKIGHALSVYKKGATYKSSDKTVAYVTSEGRVIGKKKGTVTITVKKGTSSKKVAVNVVANAKKPSIYVCTDEIVTVTNEVVTTPVEETVPEEPQTEETVTEELVEVVTGGAVTENPVEVVTGSAVTEDPKEYSYSLTYMVKNTAAKAASKIEIIGMIGKEKLTLASGKLAAGDKKSFTCEGVTDQADCQFVPTKIKVYSHKMIHTYSYETDKYSLTYATPDTEAPVITGFVGKNSYNDGMPYQIVYSDAADKYDFFKYVSATDDRDTKVDLKVDTSGANFDKTGTYKIKYTATDAAGNTAKATAKIGVRVPTSLDSMCDTVLKSIVKKSWSDTKKAQAIYNYTRGHISYTGDSDKSSWEKEAENGIRYGRGDCFTYYAVARALLTRADLVNIEVTRVRGSGHHWWNMVYVQGAFYHYDTCPRKGGGKFCLVTDAQLKEYSRTHGNSHIWDYDGKPKSGTKVLSSIF